jgi:hypothetical protein
MLGVGLLIAAALAGEPDFLARADSACDAAIESRAGQLKLEDVSHVDFLDPRKYIAESDRRDVAFWNDWTSRTLERGISPERRAVARRVCEGKIRSYLEAQRAALGRVQFRITSD